MPSRTGCGCRAPIDLVAGVPTMPLSGMLEWLAERGITDVGPDWQGRTSIPVADAQRLYEEHAVVNARAEAEILAAREAHVQAVEDLRQAITEAFVAHAGEAGTRDPVTGILRLQRQDADALLAGLEAARAVWAAAPWPVASEVYQVTVMEGDTLTSYDLKVIQPREYTQQAQKAAVVRHEKIARIS